MPQDKVKLTWFPVDTSGLQGEAKKAYTMYQTAQQAANAARKTFEQHAAKALESKGAIPAGKVPVFGYKWGKVSVAFSATAPSAVTTIKL